MLLYAFLLKFVKTPRGITPYSANILLRARKVTKNELQMDV